MNKVFLFNAKIRTLLTAYPGLKHIVVQPNFVLDNALDLINLLGAATNCRMDARSAESLGKLLKQNTSLKEIIVGHVNDPEGSRYVADGLLANKSGCIVRFVNG